MLLPALTRALRRGVGRLGGDDAVAWAIRLPLVTLVLAGAFAPVLRRPR